MNSKRTAPHPPEKSERGESDTRALEQVREDQLTRYIEYLLRDGKGNQIEMIDKFRVRDEIGAYYVSEIRPGSSDLGF